MIMKHTKLDLEVRTLPRTIGAFRRDALKQWRRDAPPSPITLRTGGEIW